MDEYDDFLAVRFDPEARWRQGAWRDLTDAERKRLRREKWGYLCRHVLCLLAIPPVGFYALAAGASLPGRFPYLPFSVCAMLAMISLPAIGAIRCKERWRLLRAAESEAGVRVIDDGVFRLERLAGAARLWSVNGVYLRRWIGDGDWPAIPAGMYGAYVIHDDMRPGEARPLTRAERAEIVKELREPAARAAACALATAFLYGEARRLLAEGNSLAADGLFCLGCVCLLAAVAAGLTFHFRHALRLDLVAGTVLLFYDVVAERTLEVLPVSGTLWTVRDRPARWRRERQRREADEA
jgi:hypothetical protein